MKTRPIINRVVAVALASVVFALAHSTQADEENARNYLEMMRADLNSAKVDTINRVLKLNETEAQKFWPIYKEYEVELGKLGDERLLMIERFVQAQTGNTLDNKLASRLSDKWFNLQKIRLDLWKKYYDKIAEAVSPIRAAQFVQVEHEVALLVDINIASEMPSIGSSTNKAAKSKE
jgi:hypothetical protein